MPARKRSQAGQPSGTLSPRLVRALREYQAAGPNPHRPYTAWDAFQRLVDLGCAESELVAGIVAILLSADAHYRRRLLHLAGVRDGRTLRRMVARWRRSAREIEQMHSCWVGVAAAGRKHLRNALNLPWLVRDFADSVEKTAKAGSRSPLNQARSSLTRYVLNKTGDPHDREVASLVGFALRDQHYSPETQKVWRHEHSRLLASRTR